MNQSKVQPLAMSGMTLNYILMPLVAGLIGWVTNYLAVKMIFRPRRPVRILGFTVQGLVPRRQKELALSIGETVEKNLISSKDVTKLLQSPEMQRQIEQLVETQVELFIREKLSAVPMISMFLQGELATQVKRLLVEQFKGSVPQLLEGMMEKIEAGLDFREVVRVKVEAFDLSTLEAIIYRISARELKTIEYLGGVLGFVVGLFQVGLLMLTT